MMMVMMMMILKGKLRMQKRGVFHQIAEHTTVHDFLCSLAFALLISFGEVYIYLE